jgi:hypothetical protein
MRKILIIVFILIVTMSILWIFDGRQISIFVDQFKTAEVTSQSLQSIGYEGSGDGGTLIINDHRLALAPLNPHVGSTKENALALASAGKVFRFGPLRASDKDLLACDISSGDNASLVQRRSYIKWPNFYEGAKPHLNHNRYFEFVCKKNNGAKLTMWWAVDSKTYITSLIRIDISNAGP